ncbi:MAG TPA: sigma-54-dependent Fis family transcriptional regulator, partial [Pseudohongiella sp.]|nr:sigma-54-dependent Fis family transcriptional regulator [Pseudohongiella sp.]
MTQILLIEDSKKLGHDLGIVLEFLGEQPVHVQRAGWTQQVEQLQVRPEALKLVLVGHYKPTLMEVLLQELIDWHEGLPIVLLGDQTM